MHLFLTGGKRSGKSTLLQRLLAGKKRIAGFYTLRTDAVEPGRYAVHLIQIGGSGTPNADNRLFFCGDPVSAECLARFDRLGCEALKGGPDVDWIVMDELGPHEEQAYRFQQAVLCTLDGDTPVLGVVQAAESAFLERIKRHPKVRLVTVTPENRDALPEQLAALLTLSERMKG